MASINFSNISFILAGKEKIHIAFDHSFFLYDLARFD